MKNPIIVLRSLMREVENEIRQLDFQYHQIAIACNSLKDNKDVYSRDNDKLFQIFGKQRHLKNNLSACAECIGILEEKLDATYNMK